MTTQKKIKNILKEKNLLSTKEKFNWKRHAYYVAKYCPQHINPELYNWEKDSATFLFYHPNHKYLKHCVWNENNIDNLKEYSKYKGGIWSKYENQIDDLLNLTKRETLLKKISKEVTLSKI